MKDVKTIKQAFLNTVGVVAYTVFIWWVMSRIPKISGPMETFWGPVALLLIFVVSATVVGTLVLGKPILLYLDGEKKSALRLLLYTIIFLAIVATVLVLVLL